MVRTRVSPPCQRGDCERCGRVSEVDGEPVFCPHECHPGDILEFAADYAKRFDLPIVPHEFVDGTDCCGCLIVREREDQADLVCNECSAVVRTVAQADVERELLAMAMSGGVCRVRCQHCGELNVILGFQSVEAFLCRDCGKGNAVTSPVQ